MTAPNGLLKSRGPGEFAGTLHGRPVMLTVGTAVGLPPSAWPYRTRRRYMRRSVVHMRKSPSAREWFRTSAFETHWPGDLTVWLAVAHDGAFAHVAVGGRGVADETLELIAADVTSFVATLSRPTA